MALTDEQKERVYLGAIGSEIQHSSHVALNIYAAIETAACAERDARIAKQRERIDWLVTEVATSADIEAEQRARIAELESLLTEKHNARVMWQSKAAELERQLAEANKIKAAAENLVKVKGRYHTEQAFKALETALQKG